MRPNMAAQYTLENLALRSTLAAEGFRLGHVVFQRTAAEVGRVPAEVGPRARRMVHPQRAVDNLYPDLG